MSRIPACLLALLMALLLALGALAPCVSAEDDAGGEAKKEAPIPPLADEAEVVEALALFKTEFKAKGMKGDEKLAQKLHVMRQLAQVQHPKIANHLVKYTKNRGIEVRTEAVIRLGEQRRIPGYAGAAVIAAMKRQSKDATFQLAGLAAIEKLKYFGAKDTLLALMAHKDYAVRKNALVTIGRMKDERFVEEIVKLMKALKLEKGAKWDGVEAHYDSGSAGDGDQKKAEAIGKAKEAKNKKKGKGRGRTQRDIGPVVLEVMFDLTGERFTGGIEARKWLDKNKADVDAKAGARAKTAAEQIEQAKADKKLR